MYILEGNIGAGKSTLLKIIKKHLPHIMVIQEPVNQWMTNKNKQESLLEHFYQSITRWSYTMETATMFSRIQEHIKVQQNPHPFKIMERSLYSGHYCFAKNGYLQGAMTPLEWEIYTSWFTFLVNQKCTTPRGLIYLYASPEICFKRAIKRSRQGEKTISLYYFEQLHQQHEAYLRQKKDIMPSLIEVPVLILDVSQEFKDDYNLQKTYCSSIESFILETNLIKK